MIISHFHTKSKKKIKCNIGNTYNVRYWQIECYFKDIAVDFAKEMKMALDGVLKYFENLYK